MTGLRQGEVKLAPYSPDWPAQFAAEADIVRRHVGDLALDVQHIGSTAVPGMDAKPIIDMAVAVESLASVPACAERLARAGYEYKGEYGLPGRHFFTKGNPTLFHLHIVEKTSEHWRVWLTFRDHLNAHADVRREYNDFKRGLARQYADNREAYTTAKHPFISNILKKIGSP